MKRKQNVVLIGGAQSFFFAVGMYLIALFFTIFLFSSLFNALNSKHSSPKNATEPPPKTSVTVKTPSVS